MQKVDLSIHKCAITGCPNKSNLKPQAFKTQIQGTNINFRIQPMPILRHHKPFVYLRLNLVPSLQWKTYTHITTTKLVKQCKLLVTCPTTMKQKIKMLTTIIRVSIGYSFYSIPYSLPAIKKLNRKVIALHKPICGLPKCMSNVVIQLPRDILA